MRIGDNIIDGVAVKAVRRRGSRRITIRVSQDGSVFTTIPYGASFADAESFFREKLPWVVKTRDRALARYSVTPAPTREELDAFVPVVSALHESWCAHLGTGTVAWKFRKMKSRWGVCNWLNRAVTYSSMLASKPIECVEYVVVHELTHLDVHDHGPRFKALMDDRLPGWRILRKRLNGR